MKRSVAAALTAVIFALITVCFLRPAPGPLGHPRPILENGTRLELSGDTEYFEYAEVVQVDYTEGSIFLKLPPVEPYVLLIGSHVGESGMTGADKGYIEKLVDGEWVYQRETYLSGMWTQEGGPPSHFSLTWNPEVVRTKYGQGYPVGFSKELFEPGDYRINLNFRQIVGSDREVGDVITISFAVTVPQPSSRRFDVAADGLRVAIHSNDGSPAPYLMEDSITIRSVETGELISDRVDEWIFFFTHDFVDGSDCPPEKQTFRPYSFAFRWDSKSEEPFKCGEYEVSFEFAENEDGSGARYPFTYTTILGQ